MSLYMLDTNTVSHLLRQHAAVVGHVIAVPMAALCISVITEGELLYGLAKRPDAKQLHLAVREFIKRVDVLPWQSATAAQYGSTRAALAGKGLTLGPLDMLIAAHALSVGATLVTNDQTFGHVAYLKVADWTVL